MIRAREEAKAEKERMKKLEASQRVMRIYGIDFQGVQLYFRQLKEAMNKKNPDDYNMSLSLLIEVIKHEYNQNKSNQQTQLMCARGLLMLMHNDQFSDYDT